MSRMVRKFTISAHVSLTDEQYEAMKRVVANAAKRIVPQMQLLTDSTLPITLKVTAYGPLTGSEDVPVAVTD